VIGVLGPGRPGELAGETALVGFIVKGSLFLPARLSLVKCLEEEKPGKLLNV